MSADRRIYRRTETGRKAWASRNSGLPPAYRRILGLIQGVVCTDEVLAAMAGHPHQQVLDWLDELDTLCFIESLPFASGDSSPRFSRAA